jgi:hypothetical protein
MKKFIPFLALVALLIVSCDKNDEGNGNVYIVKGGNIEKSENVTRIMAVIAGSPVEWAKAEQSTEGGIYTLPGRVQSGIIVETPFINGSFELRLPATLPSGMLVSVADEKKQNVSISNPSAKWTFIDFVAEIPNVNFFSKLSSDDSHLQSDGIATKSVKYVYVDRPVTLSGVATWTDYVQLPVPILGIITYEVEVRNTYNNLVLKAGWNKICREEGDVDISGEVWKSHNEFSMKDINDCKWNLGFVPQRGEGSELPDRWRPD